MNARSMLKFTLGQKFIVIGFLGILLVAPPLWMLIHATNNLIETTIGERRGINPGRKALELLQSVQQHRLLSTVELNSGKFDIQRVAKEKEINNILSSFKKSTDEDLRLKGILENFPNRWNHLTFQVNSKSITATQSFNEHNTLCKMLLDLIQNITDESGLILDPEKDTYYLMSTAFLSLPKKVEALGQARGKGAALLAQHQATDFDRALMLQLISQIAGTDEDAKKELGKALLNNPSFRILIDSLEKSTFLKSYEAMNLATNEIANATELNFPIASYLNILTSAIDAHFQLANTVITELDRLLELRIEQQRLKRNFLLIIVLSISLLVIIIGWRIAQSIRRPMEQTLKIAEAIASGNFHSQIILKGGSIEGEKMLLALHQMQNALEQSRKEIENNNQDILRKALLRAEAANEAKSRFLALMSHEIRTPMNGILGLAELMQDSPLNKEQTVYNQNILTAATGLMSLINDILDFSKIEAGEMQIESLAFDPSKILDSTFPMFHTQSKAKNVALEIHKAPDLPKQILGDPTRFRQVWLNLLSNAFKFTQQGKITATLSLKENRLLCSVEDTGMGMSSEVLSKLFQPFQQADNSIARIFGGTGLGLMISKSLVEKLGGNLQVTSTVGIGTRFYFDLPIQSVNAVQDAKTIQTTNAISLNSESTSPTDNSLSQGMENQGQIDFSKLKILLVDDQAVNRLLSRNQLHKIGCSPPTEAENGILALEQIDQRQFDVILMDMQMPEMDGLEATRQLRKRPLSKQPFVIAMTANAFAEDHAACTAAGMDHFISKPVKVDTLRSVLTLATSALKLV